MAGGDDNGNTSAKNRQHSRKFGDRNDAHQQEMANWESKIMSAWGLSNVMDAFPTSITPVSLGIKAMSNLKAIAVRIPNLADAQARFLQEAKNANGDPVAFGFKHTASILAGLMAIEKDTPKDKGDNVLGKASAEKQSGSRKRVSKAPAIPNDLIAPGAKDKAPFSFHPPKVAVGADLPLDTDIPKEGSMSAAADRGNSILSPIAPINSGLKPRPASLKLNAPLGLINHRKRSLTQQFTTARHSNDLGSPLPKKVKNNDENKPLAPQTHINTSTHKHMEATKGQENHVSVPKKNPKVVFANAEGTKDQEISLVVPEKSSKIVVTATKTTKGRDTKSLIPEMQPKVVDMEFKGAIFGDLAQKVPEKATSLTIEGTNLPEEPTSSPLQLESHGQREKLNEICEAHFKKNEEFFKKMAKSNKYRSKEVVEKQDAHPNSILASFEVDQDTIVVDHTGDSEPEPLNTPSGKYPVKDVSSRINTSKETVASAVINGLSPIRTMAQEALSYDIGDIGKHCAPVSSFVSADINLSLTRQGSEEPLRDDVQRLRLTFPLDSTIDSQNAPSVHNKNINNAAAVTASCGFSAAASSSTTNVRAPVAPMTGNGGPSPADILFNEKLMHSLTGASRPFHINPDRNTRSHPLEPGTLHGQGSMRNTMMAPPTYPAANSFLTDPNMGVINEQGCLIRDYVSPTAVNTFPRAENALRDDRGRDPGARTDLAMFCNNLKDQVRRLLNPRALAAFRTADKAAADELKSVFTTTVRHLESDVDFALSKSNKAQGKTGFGR